MRSPGSRTQKGSARLLWRSADRDAGLSAAPGSPRFRHRPSEPARNTPREADAARGSGAGKEDVGGHIGQRAGVRPLLGVGVGVRSRPHGPGWPDQSKTAGLRVHAAPARAALCEPAPSQLGRRTRSETLRRRGTQLRLRACRATRSRGPEPETGGRGRTHLSASARGQRGAAPRIHVVSDAQHPEQCEAQQHARAPPHPPAGLGCGDGRGRGAGTGASGRGRRRSAPGRKRGPGGGVREQRAANRSWGWGLRGAGPRLHGGDAPPPARCQAPEWQVAAGGGARAKAPGNPSLVPVAAVPAVPMLILQQTPGPQVSVSFIYLDKGGDLDVETGKVIFEGTCFWG